MPPLSLVKGPYVRIDLSNTTHRLGHSCGVRGCLARSAHGLGLGRGSAGPGKVAEERREVCLQEAVRRGVSFGTQPLGNAVNRPLVRHLDGRTKHSHARRAALRHRCRDEQLR